MPGSGEIALIITTPRDRHSQRDGSLMRSAAWQHGVRIITTLSRARAAARGIGELKQRPLRVRSLQAHHGIAAYAR